MNKETKIELGQTAGGAVVGAGVLGWIGAGAGIAISGSAIAATAPFAITGAVVGGLGVLAYKKVKGDLARKQK